MHNWPVTKSSSGGQYLVWHLMYLKDYVVHLLCLLKKEKKNHIKSWKSQDGLLGEVK